MSPSDLSFAKAFNEQSNPDSSGPSMEQEPTPQKPAPELTVVSAEVLEQQEADKEERTFNAGDAAIQAFYSDAYLAGPSSQVDGIQTQAVFANRILGTSEWTIGNGIGSLANQTREEAAKEKEDEAQEWFENMIDQIEEQKEQREEEWHQRQINLGAGVTMSGEEIDGVLELLGNKESRQKFADAFKKKTGANDKDANQAVSDYQRYLQLIQQREEEHKPLSAADQAFVEQYPQTKDGQTMITIGKESASWGVAAPDQSTNTQPAQTTSYSREQASAISAPFNEAAAAPQTNSTEIKIQLASIDSPPAQPQTQAASLTQGGLGI